MPERSKRQTALLYGGLCGLAVAGVVVARVAQFGSGWIALSCFVSVMLGALLISWAAEAAQFLVSQGFAIAAVALLQVLPEFMVEAVIAWDGNVPLMFANLTGSNRLLMGLGWPLVYFTADIASRLKRGRPLGAVTLRPEAVFEVGALLVSSLYFVVVMVKSTLTIWDAMVLIGIFVVYMVALFKLPHEEHEKISDLPPAPRALLELPHLWKWVSIGGLFLLAGAVMSLVAHPFVDSMEKVALMLGISSFIFVQWCAPFLTEFPEKLTAFYWSKQITKAPMALLNFVSSKTNQWTLLAAMVPIVYSLGRGRWMDVPVDHAHTVEVFLSMAMTLYGCAVLSKRRFTRENAVWMFSLWLVQFTMPGEAVWLPRVPILSNDVRLWTGAIFLALGVIEIVRFHAEIHPIDDLRIAFGLQREKRKRSD